MPKRLLSRRPNESNAAQGTECEVFVIDERPIEKKLLKFTFQNEQDISLKDVVEMICEKLKILPVHSALFGISYDQFGGKHYLPYSTKVDKDFFSKKKPVYFRLQFKIVDCGTFKNDPNAFNYYILQCRHDFVHGQFKENLFQMPSEPRKQEMLLRMLILEMLLVSKDENMARKDSTSHLHQIFKRRHPFSIEDVLTKYIDDRSKNRSEEVKKCKKIIEKSLQMFNSVEKPEMDFVREVSFLPEYSREVFENLVKVYGVKEATVLDNVWISVHPAEGISRIRSMDGRFQRVEEKTPFSKISHLVIKENTTNPHAPKYQLFVGKKENQQPEVFSTDSLEDLQCICSWVDGYYRLLVDQYTCLLEDREISTKVHGPIDRNSAVQLLESIKCNEGDYIVRQHRNQSKSFVITVRRQDTFEHNEFSKNNDMPIEEFLKTLRLQPGYLKRLIKPSMTGPVPFMSELLKTMPTLKKAVSAQKVEVQMLHLKSVIKQNELPKGRFGTVWHCKQRKDAGLTLAAIRFFQDDEITQQTFEKICRLYMQISSRVIVRITGRSELTDNPRFLAFEYMNGGPLSKYLAENRNTIRYRNLLKYFSDIAEGMMYLEVDLNLMHGNLSCHNVLMLENGDVKISDCCFDVILQQEGALNLDNIDSSCNWRAPEVLNGEPITHHSDAWSFGMTLWQMMALSIPFGPYTKNELLEILNKGIRPPLESLPYCHAEIKEILMSSWSLNPAERNNFKRICDRLERYRRGGGALSADKDSPVPTFLMNRHYYNWRQEEAAEKKMEEQRREHVNRQIKNAFAFSSGSSESVNTGSSSSGSGSFVLSRSGGSSCEVGSVSSRDSEEAVRLLNTRQQSLESQVSVSTAGEKDVEMQSLSNVDLESPASSSSIEAGNDGLRQGNLRRSKKRLIKDGEDTMQMEVNDLDEPSLLSKSKSRRLSSGSSGKDEKAGSNEECDSGLSETCSKEREISIAMKPSHESDMIESAPAVKKSDQADQTVLEIANVLASMAQNREADKKKVTSDDYITMRDAQGPLNSIFPASTKQQGIHFFQNWQDSSVEQPGGNFVKREQLESGYDSGSSYTATNIGKITHGAKSVSKRQQKNGIPNQGFSQDSQMIIIEPDITERKKRSNSLSQEITNMQKKAARRALDRPNPFNLGATIPKNFLLPSKDPIQVRTQTQQPREMSKFFNEIPQTFSTVMQDNHAVQQPQQLEESFYKTDTDIRNLEEKLGGLKASSPASANCSLMDDSNSKLHPAQSLAYVVSPNQPLINQATTDQSAIQATINAYLANLGQSLVAGNSVLLPQITLNTPTGQSAANSAQILQLLQAQQKAGQTNQTSTQEELIQNKTSIDPSVHFSTANCLQTLLAIVASKGIISSATATHQQQKIAPTSSMIQQPQQTTRIIAATTAQLMSPAIHPLAVKGQDQMKKVIDIKPKPAATSSDAVKSDSDVIMVPVSVKGSVDQTNKLSTANSIGILHPFDNSRSLPVSQRPLSVVAMQHTRPTLTDAKLPMTRPLLVKANAGAQSVRTQHLILPKNLPEKLGKIEQAKEVKLAPKPVTLAPRIIKAEPVSPQEIRPKPVFMQGYKTMGTIASQSNRSASTEQRPLSMDIVRSLSDKVVLVQNRKKSVDKANGEEQQRKLIAQLGDLKVFRKEDLTFQRKLGEGQFGEVWQAMLRYQSTNRGEVKEGPVAVKKLKTDKDRRLQVIEEFRNEVKQMASLEHEFIVRLIGVSIDPTDEINDPWIITEWMPQGNLEHFIVTQRQSRRIVHRDLATRNVLVESRDRVKVCDFGLSRMFGEKDYYRASQHRGLIPIRWYAPESISEQKFTAESDVWSFGVTLWEMFELLGSDGKHAAPYTHIDHRQILDFLEKGGRLNKPRLCRGDLWNLVLGCWAYNPDERYSFYRLSYEIRNLIPTYSSEKMRR
eukprot:gene2848-1083_t